MIYLHNRTYISIYKHEAVTASGIILIPSFFSPRGACAVGRVQGVGSNPKPVIADYKEGDLVVFQKNAATGVGVDGYDLKLFNIDVLAKLSEDGSIIPLNSNVLCEHIQFNETVTNSGIIIQKDAKEFNHFGTVVRIGKNVSLVAEGENVIMDSMSGSYVATDGFYRISDTVSNGFKMCLLYNENAILAKELVV